MPLYTLIVLILIGCDASTGANSEEHEPPISNDEVRYLSLDVPVGTGETTIDVREIPITIENKPDNVRINKIYLWGDADETCYYAEIENVGTEPIFSVSFHSLTFYDAASTALIDDEYLIFEGRSLQSTSRDDDNWGLILPGEKGVDTGWEGDFGYTFPVRAEATHMNIDMSRDDYYAPSSEMALKQVFGGSGESHDTLFFFIENTGSKTMHIGNFRSYVLFDVNGKPVYESQYIGSELRYVIPPGESAILDDQFFDFRGTAHSALILASYVDYDTGILPLCGTQPN